jgi:hypothetical protein
VLAVVPLDQVIVEHGAQVKFRLPTLCRPGFPDETSNKPSSLTPDLPKVRRFSNRPSACRKLHDIANSAIIFDEAQTLPCPY